MSVVQNDPSAGASGTSLANTNPSPGKKSWFFIAIDAAIGGVSLGLSLSEEFASDKAVFATSSSRITLGVVGALFLLLSLRGTMRLMQGYRPHVDQAAHRRVRMLGSFFLVVGASFLAACWFDAISENTVSFRLWTKPFYVTSGIYLMLLGLIAQWNPTRAISEQRVRGGEGMPAVARILRASDTGVSVNDAPQVEIEFAIKVDGRDEYEASDRIVMDRAKLALLIPGSTVDVLVDRVDPKVFHIDWDSWQSPGTESQNTF